MLVYIHLILINAHFMKDVTQGEGLYKFQYHSQSRSELLLKLNTLHKELFVEAKLHLPVRNTLEEDCFVAPQSHGTQSKASGVLKLCGNNLFLKAKNILWHL